MLLSRLWARCTQYAASVQSVFLQDAVEQQTLLPRFPEFQISSEWLILAPFQMGTRETPWSSDSLEFEGGFHNLKYDPNATYRSALAFNGSVSWINRTATISPPDPRFSKASLHVDVTPGIDWPFLQDVYGWPGHQWLGWARGEIYIQSEERKSVILYLNNILEYWIDGTRHFGGDFYADGRAPITLHLDPGVHQIEIKLTGDVRAIGGLGSPTVNVSLELWETLPGLSIVRHGDEAVLISDIVGDEYGPFGSPYAAITARNDAERDLHVLDLVGTPDYCIVELLQKPPIRFVVGQTRPIGFRIGCISAFRRQIILHLRYRIDGEDEERSMDIVTWPNVIRGIDQTQKITYLHPSGIVSWGILRPPASYAQCGDSPNSSIPVMPTMHGAGVRADDYAHVHMFDPLPGLCAWIIFPQGTTTWSGDDWHNWGFADVEAAIASIPQWIKQVHWEGPGVDINRWLVAGHSNGGQGVWYAITHRPDKIIAAAALSGYSSVQNYVPYSSWRTVDPGRMEVMQAALSPYRHDLLVDNTKDIPLVIQHGSKDDNVPAYHSRLMNLRIFEGDGECNYFEIPDQGHFWDGVATTKPLRHFFRKQLELSQPEDDHAPVNLRSFSIVVADPGGMGPKNGVKVLQLLRPGQLGRIDFAFDALTWACVFRTSNIEHFFVPQPFDICDHFAIDGQELGASGTASASHGGFIKTTDGWAHESSVQAKPSHMPRRTGRQLGQMDAILRTRGTFQIVQHCNETGHIAPQISRNFAEYFAADTEISDDYDAALAADGNVISVAIGDTLPDGPYPGHPISLGKRALTIRDNGVSESYFARERRCLAAIFLRPLPDERLELVVWGIDALSLEMAARLVPMMTGSGQPDWVVLDETMMWKGLDGTLALGFFKSDWEVSRNSFFS